MRRHFRSRSVLPPQSGRSRDGKTVAVMTIDIDERIV